MRHWTDWPGDSVTHANDGAIDNEVAWAERRTAWSGDQAVIDQALDRVPVGLAKVLPSGDRGGGPGGGVHVPQRAVAPLARVPAQHVERAQPVQQRRVQALALRVVHPGLAVDERGQARPRGVVAVVAGARRADSTGPFSLQVDDLRLDRLRHVARRGERQIELTAREVALLDYLMSRAGHVVSRDQIIHAVWPQDFDGGSNVVDTYVHYIREKVDRPPARRLIRTVRGVGYVLEG